MLYFDHSATTPIHPDVLSRMQSVSKDHFGNPSSVHRTGRESRSIIESARRIIANCIHADPNEIIFTGSGTEANNAVLYSLVNTKKQHVISTNVEHPAVFKVLKMLEPLGVTYTALSVDQYGYLNPKKLEAAIQSNTGLISVMFVNNEVGTINPIKSLSRIADLKEIPFHSDTVQALGKIPISVKDFSADYFCFSAHKFYGPKGVGFLYKRKGAPLNPFIIGGSQESNLRAGTENVPGIAGLAEAVALATKNLNSRISHLNQLEGTFKSEIDSANLNVVYNGHPEHRVPGLVSVSFIGQKNDILLAKLDRKDISVSSGSACGSGSIKPSPVLEAMGISETQNISTLRISFGRQNTVEDVKTLVYSIASIING